MKPIDYIYKYIAIPCKNEDQREQLSKDYVPELKLFWNAKIIKSKTDIVINKLKKGSDVYRFFKQHPVKIFVFKEIKYDEIP